MRQQPHKNERTFFCSMLSVAGLLALAIQAQAAPAAGAAGAFLKLGQNARALALGGAYAAAVADATAAYWNPALLDRLERQELFLAYTVLPGGGDYSQLVYALPLSEFSYPADGRAGSPGRERLGTLALSFNQLGTAYDIEARRVDSLNPNYLFSDLEGCYGLAYGMTLAPGWQAGAQVKGLYHRLDQTQASGWGVDAGAAWEAAPGLTAALTIRNALAQLSWSRGTTERFPPAGIAAIAYRHDWGGGNETLAAGALEKRWTSEAAEPMAGIEYAWRRLLFARAGFNGSAFTWGAGAQLAEIGWGRTGAALDYAAVPDPIDGWQHWASLRIRF